MLGVIGLDCLAEQVYRALLEEPESGVGDLSERLATAEPQIRECLATLERLTLLRASWETPGALRPVSPQVGLPILVRHQELDLVRRQQELARGRMAAATLVADYDGLRRDAEASARAQPRPLIGLDAVRSRLEELAQRATSDVVAVVPGSGQRKDVLDAIGPHAAGLLERSVRVRILAQDAMTTNRDTVGFARRLIEGGGHVRSAPVLPSAMFAVDAGVAVVPLRLADGPGAVEVSDAGVVAALLAGFEYAWERAAVLETAQRRSTATVEPSDADLELLKLLATGVTDEAIANRLGVSLRTVRRRVFDLMGRLEASSRFDAGCRAVQRGWL